MRAFGTLLTVVGLVAGLALTAFLFQWDSVQRAATVVATAASGASSDAAGGAAQGAGAPISGEKPGEAAIQSGKAAYNRSCNSCHPNGKAGVGPAITGLGDESVKVVVRQGKGGMPGFGEAQISDAQMAEMLAYIKSLK